MSYYDKVSAKKASAKKVSAKKVSAKKVSATDSILSNTKSKMENIITTTAKFIKVKSELDGLVFWRDLPDNKVEIKFNKSLVNKISKKTIKFLNNIL